MLLMNKQTNVCVDTGSYIAFMVEVTNELF